MTSVFRVFPTKNIKIHPMDMIEFWSKQSSYICVNVTFLP